MVRRALVALILACCAKAPAPYVEPATGMTFVPIPAGAFVMGSRHRPDERPHCVTITKPFSLSTTEVTQRQWTAAVGTNPSHFRGDPDAPVEQITWYDAKEFIARLNHLGHGKFRLPTEAEWEYACRAGSATEYSAGNALPESAANYDREKTARVKTFAPNAWGIYDMHGNVWEWCEDEYCPYPDSPAVDPKPAQCGSGLKVIRGGSFYFGADSARSALRYTHAPELKGFSIGLRLVRELD
jgi:formylglycine-generating enzyme required for sulfatase activity